VSNEDTIDERKLFVKFMKRNWTGNNLREVLVLLAANCTLQASYPNLSKLSRVGLLLPMTTVDCEGSFSPLERVKTTLRNRLKENT
jgi:hypothetical protein